MEGLDEREKLSKKAKIIIISAVVLTVLVAIAVILAVIFSGGGQPQESEVRESQGEKIAQHEITSSDGSEFDANVSSVEENYEFRIADISCDDDSCGNVKTLMINGRTMTRGVDYELRKGSVIVVLFAQTLQSYSGKVEVKVDVEVDGEIQEVKVGLRVDNPSVPSEGTTVKEVMVFETIPFPTRIEDEVNMPRGSTRTSQIGQSGEKKITYRVVYGEDGKEVSRVKIGETITKPAVDQIMEKGVSDYNINTDSFGMLHGFICTQSQWADSEGCEGTGMHFYAIRLKGAYYLACMGSSCSTYAEDLSVNVKPLALIGEGSKVTYGGVEYIVDGRAGVDGGEHFTDAICSKFGLACGRW